VLGALEGHEKEREREREAGGLNFRWEEKEIS